MEVSGYIALIVSIIGSRIIYERGYRLLSNEEKLRLMDGFSNARAYSLIPLLVLVGAYYLLMTKTAVDEGVLTIGYFALLIAFVVVRSIISQKKMVSLNLPGAYRRYFTVAQVVSLVGVAWFFYTMLGAKAGR